VHRKGHAPLRCNFEPKPKTKSIWKQLVLTGNRFRTTQGYRLKAFEVNFKTTEEK